MLNLGCPPGPQNADSSRNWAKDISLQPEFEYSVDNCTAETLKNLCAPLSLSCQLYFEYYSVDRQ